MKLCIIFSVLILATICVQGSSVAVTTTRESHAIKASSVNSPVRLWTRRLVQYLTHHKNKRPQAQPSLHKPSASVQAIEVETPELVQLLNTLTWLSEKNIQDWILYDIATPLLDGIWAFMDFEKVLTDAFNGTLVNITEVLHEFYDGGGDDYLTFWQHSDDYWEAWFEDRENAYDEFLEFLPHFQTYLTTYTMRAFNHFNKILDLESIFLTSAVQQQVQAELDVVLARIGNNIDELNVVLYPPQETVGNASEVTLKSFLDYWPYLAGLNASAMVVGGIDTYNGLVSLRLQFNEDISALLLAAGGAALQEEGEKVITRFEAAVEDRRVKNLDLLEYALFLRYNQGPIDAQLYALFEMMYGWMDGLQELPPVTVEAINELVALVGTTEPEYVQQARVLVQTALQAAGVLVRDFKNIFARE